MLTRAHRMLNTNWSRKESRTPSQPNRK